MERIRLDLAYLLIITILVLSSILTVPVQAQSINVTISPDRVTATMNLEVVENVTMMSPPPQLSLHLTGNNASLIIQPITSQIRAKIPTANVQSLDFKASANLTNPAKEVWILTENLTFVLTGVTTSTGSRIAANIAFLWMNVSDSIGAGQPVPLELNRVGETYLLPALKSYPTGGRTRFYMDGAGPLMSPQIPEITTRKFSMLDFTWVSPLSHWSVSQDVLKQSTTWYLYPPAAYNLSIGILTPENTFIPQLVAYYGPSLTITVSSNAEAQGNIIYFNVPDRSELLMPTIIIASVAVLAGTTLYDRTISQPLRHRRKK